MRPTALVAAAVLLGALAGFGVRERALLRAFAGAGLRLRGLPEFVTPDRGLGLDALLGIAHTVLLGLLWGAVVALVAARMRRWSGWGAAVAAALVIAGVLLLDPRLPAPLRLAAGAIGGAERAVCAVALVVASAATASAAQRATPGASGIGMASVARAPRGADDVPVARDVGADGPS